MEGNKDLNRLKVMLAEKKRTNKWLAVSTLRARHLACAKLKVQ